MKWRGIYRMMLENNIDNREMIMKYTRNISPRIEKYYVVTSSSSIPSRVRQHLDESADTRRARASFRRDQVFRATGSSFTVRWNLDEANYRAYRTRPFQQIALARGGKRVGAIAPGSGNKRRFARGEHGKSVEKSRCKKQDGGGGGGGREGGRRQRSALGAYFHVIGIRLLKQGANAVHARRPVNRAAL